MIFHQVLMEDARKWLECGWQEYGRDYSPSVGEIVLIEWVEDSWPKFPEDYGNAEG